MIHDSGKVHGKMRVIYHQFPLSPWSEKMGENQGEQAVVLMISESLSSRTGHNHSCHYW